jgi:tricorn protease
VALDLPRRHRDRAAREGRRPQPDALRPAQRPLPGLVARRHRRSPISRDQGGEYALVLATQDGKQAPRNAGAEGRGLLRRPRWSPDGKKLRFADNSRALYVLDVASGAQTKIDADPIYGPVRTLHHAWSPDSQWLAYTRNNPTFINQVWMYSLAEKKSRPVTDGLSDARRPVFDKSGKYLYFLVSTDAGPVQDWFSHGERGHGASQSIYLACCRRTRPSPLAKESDEEGAKKDETKKEGPLQKEAERGGRKRRRETKAADAKTAKPARSR